MAITQSQPGDPYDLDVAIDTEYGHGVHTVRLSEASTEVVVPSGGPSTGVRLLIWTPEYGPKP